MAPLDFESLRLDLTYYLENQRGIHDPAVLDAFAIVPRHLFVPGHVEFYGYEDKALPIGFNQTISQPSLLAYMLEKLQLKPTDVVLEIGSGSGYLTALLSRIVTCVYGIEIIPELVERSKDIIQSLGYSNINLEYRNGQLGWPDKAPFDVIIISAETSHIESQLFAQLRDGGRLIAPIHQNGQTILMLYTHHERMLTQEPLIPVKFVPLL